VLIGCLDAACVLDRVPVLLGAGGHFAGVGGNAVAV
jgi:hypothetical protein